MKDPVKKYFPLFVLPVFVCFCLCFVLPFVQGVYLSFCNFFIPKDAHFTGISNYVTVFRDTSFWHAFLITSLYAVSSIICVNVPAFFIAYLLKERGYLVPRLILPSEPYRRRRIGIYLEHAFRRNFKSLWNIPYSKSLIRLLGSCDPGGLATDWLYDDNLHSRFHRSSGRNARSIPNGRSKQIPKDD